MYEEYIPTETKGLGTDQYDSEDSLDVFISPATERDFMRLQTLSQIWLTQRPFTLHKGNNAYNISICIYKCYCQPVTYRKGWKKY